MEQVLKAVAGISIYKDTILCPFHLDSKQSAKIYHDVDGDRIYCYTESKQFSISDLLKLYEEDLSKWDPIEGIVEEKKRSWDYSILDGFKEGKIDILEFFSSLLNLKRLVE